MSHRLCKLFSCRVRGPFVLSCVRLLTISTLRLNSRDYIRDRSTATAENAIHLSSIRIQPSSNGHGPKCEPPGVSATVHRSPRLNLGRAKSDHDVEPTFDVPKPVRYLHLLATSISILIILSAGKYHRFSKPRSNVGVERVGCYGATGQATVQRITNSAWRLPI